MKKNFFFRVVGFILVGAIGGILGSAILLPWLAGTSWFGRFEWFRHFKDGTTIINQTQQITITENEALQNVVAKESNKIVGIISQATERIINKKKVQLAKPETLSRGSGFILTSDGLIVTTDLVAPEAAQQFLVAIGDKQIGATVQKRDKASGLVLLKINENNLPVVSFPDAQPKLGERVFLIAAEILTDQSGKTQLNKFVEADIIRQLSPQIKINFSSKDISGSPVFNIKGEVIGVNLIDSAGLGKIISAQVIMNLLK